MSTKVNYMTVLKNGDEVDYQVNASCYSTLTYQDIPQDAKEIITWHTPSQIPYTVKEIKRWIADINEMGFPCSYEGLQIREVSDSDYDDDDYWADDEDDDEDGMVSICRKSSSSHVQVKCHVFKIPLKEYKYKLHLSSALTLVRYLIEDYINSLPEYYFKLMDANPTMDKFMAMQIAHIGYRDDGYYNSNHTVRTENVVTLITKEVLFERFEKTKKLIHDGNNYYSISDAWKGTAIDNYQPIITAWDAKDYKKVIELYNLN